MVKVKSKILYRLWGRFVYLGNKSIKKQLPKLSNPDKLLNSWNSFIVYITTKFDFQMLRKSCENKYTCSIWYRPMPKADDIFVKTLAGWTMDKDGPNIKRIKDPIIVDNYLKRTGQTLADDEAKELTDLKNKKPDDKRYRYLDKHEGYGYVCPRCKSRKEKLARKNKITKEKELWCTACCYVFTEKEHKKWAKEKEEGVSEKVLIEKAFKEEGVPL